MNDVLSEQREMFSRIRAKLEPNYSKGAMYQKLVELCSLAGVTVEYTELRNGVLGSCNCRDRIKMSTSHFYGDQKLAGITLGHELAHVLMENIDPPQSSLDKAEVEKRADIIGAAFYAFAELVFTKQQNERNK